MKKLKITSKKHGEFVTLIDNEDFERLTKLKNMKWCACPKRGHIYFQKRFSDQKIIELHRFIMDAKHGEYVDHINHNTLDNRRKNLRVCTNSANIRNGKLRINNKSGYQGIYFDKKRDNWEAQIKVRYKVIHLGRYNSFRLAVKARKIAEAQYWND